MRYEHDTIERIAAVAGRSLCLVALAACVAAMTGCRGDRSEKPPRQFFPDLDDQPKYKPQGESHFFEDFEASGDAKAAWGMTQRLPVDGTIPFGRTVHADVESASGVLLADRSSFLKQDDPFFTGKGADGEPIEFMPVAVDSELIELGRSKYAIYCIQCHGGTGAGDGLVGKRWANAMPSFHSETYQVGGELGQDGHIFDIIRNGKLAVGMPWKYAMPPYGDKVSEREAWAIVSYIRVLQASRTGTIEDVPQGAVRNRLISEFGGGGGVGEEDGGVETAQAGGAQ